MVKYLKTIISNSNSAHLTDNLDGSLDHLFLNNPALFFVGIGGIGMSGLALCLKNMGYAVSGSDLKKTPLTRFLEDKFIPVFYGHHTSHVPPKACLIISSAIPKNNPEVQEARRLGLTIIKRGALLGYITRQKKTIAITGSHGKTTTSSLIGKLLVAANEDPLILTGGIMQEYDSNVFPGSGAWIVAEADESDATHTCISPEISVLTNIDTEHLSFYKTEKILLDSFCQFLESTPRSGARIACLDCARTEQLMAQTSAPCITYGFHPNASVRILQHTTSTQGLCLTIRLPDGTVIQDLESSLYGNHNAQNIAAMVATSFYLGFSEETLRHALKTFKGVKRRFTQLGQAMGITFIDDYAHHPTEITHAIKTAQGLCQGQVIAVCEPHRYSRVRELSDAFIAALSLAKKTILLPIYSAGERPVDGVSSQAISCALQSNGHWSKTASSATEAAQLLSQNAQTGDTILFMGAGLSSHIAKETLTCCLRS